jgi:hypothetical protein
MAVRARVANKPAIEMVRSELDFMSSPFVGWKM